MKRFALATTALATAGAALAQDATTPTLGSSLGLIVLGIVALLFLWRFVFTGNSD